MTGLFDLAGKTALVTGGAHGLGRMMAEALLRASARVIITSRRSAENAAMEMSALGDCTGLDADLGSAEAATALAAAVAGLTDRLDILVNNAGKTWGAPIEAFPDKAWTGVMAVNVQAPFTLVRDLLPLLEHTASPDNPARIINIGSAAGVSVQRLSAYSYTASKAAIHHLSRELAADLASRHITVNIVVPGYFPTSMTSHIRADEARAADLKRAIPLGRMGDADDIGGVIVFLCSRAGSYITGAAIPVDGGLVGCR